VLCYSYYNERNVYKIVKEICGIKIKTYVTTVLYRAVFTKEHRGILYALRQKLLETLCKNSFTPCYKIKTWRVYLYAFIIPTSLASWVYPEYSQNSFIKTLSLL